MINNSTTSLDTKTSYTSVETSKKPAVGSSPAAPPATPADKGVEQKAVSDVAPQEQQANAVKDEAVQKKAQELRKRVTEAIPKVVEALNKNQNRLDFKVSEQTKRVIITVYDKETDKVIRQIPPEELLKVAEAVDQGQKPSLEGLIIDSKA